VSEEGAPIPPLQQSIPDLGSSEEPSLQAISRQRFNPVRAIRTMGRFGRSKGSTASEITQDQSAAENIEQELLGDTVPLADTVLASPSFSEDELAQSSGMDAAVDVSSPVAFTASMVGYAKEHPDEMQDRVVGRGRYAEIHLVHGEPLVAISPRSMRPHGATIEGTHSIIDELRIYDGKDFPRFMHAIDKFGGKAISTDTVVAKGLLRPGTPQEPSITLELGNLTAKDLNWLGDLQVQAERMGLDGGVVLQEKKRKGLHSVELDKLPTSYHIRTVSLKTLRDLGVEVPQHQDIKSGIVTGAEVSDVVWLKQELSDTAVLSKRITVGLEKLEANSVLHQPLYDQAGMDDPHGYIVFNLDGQPVKLGVRYGTDIRLGREPTQSINLFYEQDYGSKLPAAFQRAMISAVRETMPHLSDVSPLVTIARGPNVPLEKFHFR
jgi:hypothetical protein